MVSPIARLYAEDMNPHGSPIALPSRVQAFAFEADLSNDQIVGTAAAVALGFALLVGVAIVGDGWQLLGGLAVLVLGPTVLAVRARGRRRRRLVAALPELIDSLGRSLRSGASLGQALREACVEAPPVVATELRMIVTGLELGETGHRALQAWVQRNPVVEVRIVAAALAVASENEAGTGQALAGVAQALRDRQALAAEIRSHTAQSAASMQAMVWLPIGLVALDALGDRSRLRYLTEQPIGQACLAAALVLTSCGWLWMRLIIRRRFPS